MRDDGSQTGLEPWRGREGDKFKGLGMIKDGD